MEKLNYVFIYFLYTTIYFYLLLVFMNLVFLYIFLYIDIVSFKMPQ